MASEKLHNLINEFASDGIISENEFALLKEKANEELLSEDELNELINKALYNFSAKAEEVASGFISFTEKKINNIKNSKESGFITQNSDNEQNMVSGFVSENKFSSKSAFEEGEDFFKNEQLLPNQGSMSQISIGTRHIRKVVIKRLKEKDRKNQKYIELLYKEFQNSLLLEHPNIVRVYDSGQDSKGAYYYMEFIDGRPLSVLIQNFGIQDHKLVKKIALEILSALDYVHKKQVFHRDLKPENILITYKGNNTKILDFGLALTDDFDDNMQKVGTPKYAAPEQNDADLKVDGRSDLYSFGLILTEMITGNIKNLDKVETYSKKLRKIIEKCTEPFAHNRYLSAYDVICDIEKIEIENNKFVDKKFVKKEQKNIDTNIKTQIQQTKPKAEKKIIAKPQKKEKKSSYKIWIFFIILSVFSYYVGSELEYWGNAKKENIYSESPRIMYISAKRLRLRSSKSLKIKNVIGLYHKGTQVQVLEMNNQWAKVKIDNKEGYMAFPQKYLSDTK